jgi:hypothetical protein
MLILLTDTRKKLLWLWLGFTAAIVLLFFVQTLAGKYEDIEGQAWTWVFVQLMPALLLLFVAVLLNKNPSKVLLRATFRALYFGTLAYLLLVALTLLSMPVATLQWSISEYLDLSYTWLAPFQAFLLLAFGLLYFRKEPLFRPTAAIMEQYVAKKAEFAQRAGNSTQVSAFQLLTTENGVKAVLNLLSSQLKNDATDITLLQNQYAFWEQQRDLNTMAPDALQRELNRLTMATVGYVERL